MDWFQWTTHSLWLQEATLFFACAFLVISILAHWFIIVPGPVTPRERKAVLLPTWRRWFQNMLLPFLAFGLVLASLDMIAPVRIPVNLVLYSRAIPASMVEKSDQAESTAENPNNSNVSKETPQWEKYLYLDMGPSVDKMMKYLEEKGAREWSAGSIGQRQKAREIVLSHIADCSPEKLHTNQKPSKISSSMPVWLIESVEISMISIAMEQFNVKRVIIQSGIAKKKIHGWPLASKILSKSKQIPIQCKPVNVESQELAIACLFQATITKDGELIFGALIEGSFTTETLGLPLENAKSQNSDKIFYLKIENESSQQTIHKFSFKVPYDKRSRRIVFVKEKLVSEITKAKLKLVEKDGRHCADIVDLRDRPQNLKLHVASERYDAWKSLIHEIFTVPKNAEKKGDRFYEFREEIKQMEILPLTADIVADQADVCLWENSECLVIAKDERVAYKAWQQHAKESSDNSEQNYHLKRVKNETVGNATVFSWFMLPLWVQNKQNFALEPSKIVHTGSIDGQKFVLLDINVDKYGIPDYNAERQKDWYDPQIMPAVLRSIAWASNFVSQSQGIQHYISKVEDVKDIEVSPLVNETDIENLVSVGFMHRRFLSIFLAGFYLSLLVWRIAYQMV